MVSSRNADGTDSAAARTLQAPRRRQHHDRRRGRTHDSGHSEDRQAGQDDPPVTKPIPQPRAEHQQPAEEHGIAGRDQAGCIRRRVQVRQHRRQRRHHDGHAENIDELHQAQRHHTQPYSSRPAGVHRSKAQVTNRVTGVSHPHALPRSRRHSHDQRHSPVVPDTCPIRRSEAGTHGHSSLKERGRVNGWIWRGFASRRACVTGLSYFPGSCYVRVSGRAGQGPGGARPLAAPEASLRRSPGSPMIWPRGNGSGDGMLSGCSGPSHCRGFRCGQCRWLRSSLRLARAEPGAWGGSASGKAVRRGQSRGRARRQIATALSDRRPRAWPLARGLFMPSAVAGPLAVSRLEWGPGSGSVRRACRSRPG